MANSTPEPQRDAAAVRVFPPAIPALTILTGSALSYLWPIDLSAIFPAPPRYWFGGLIVVGAILGLGLWTFVLLRSSGQSENPWTPTTEIVARGPFRLSRNPMYLQMVLVCLGFGVLLADFWILALTPVCAWL